MKRCSVQGHWHGWLPYGLGGLFGVALVSLLGPLLPVTADPGLTIRLLGTNQIELAITNAQPSEAFEIQKRLAFGASYPWTAYLAGTIGQTSFVAEMGNERQGWFRALGCLDCDQDGILNWLDGNPTNATIGTLSITIDSPAHGSVLN